MENIISVFYWYRPLRKLCLSAFIGIGLLVVPCFHFYIAISNIIVRTEDQIPESIGEMDSRAVLIRKYYLNTS